MMTSETGNQRKNNVNHAVSKRAFTILEVLLVIALMAITMGFIVFNFDGMRSSIVNASPDKEFIKAMKIARIDALDKGKETSLSYDPESGKIFCKVFESGEILFEKQISKPESPLKLEIIPQYAHCISSMSSMFEGRDVLPYMRFSPDGSATPVLIKFDFGSKIKILNPDPFSGNLRKVEDDE